MTKLKSLSAAAVPAALERAAHYRLLNEPMLAESICRDVLRVESHNQEALITLLLAQTDQFDIHMTQAFKAAQQTLERLTGEYERTYYGALICERRAHWHLDRGAHGSGPVAYDWYRKAMDLYEAADEHSPPDNNDAVLRWNTCVRILRQRPNVKPTPKDTFQPLLE